MAEKPTEKTETNATEKTETNATEKTARKDDNFVYIGKKPAMSYVLAVVTQFTDGHKDVHIKARGRSISRAVDVAEIVKNKFVKDTNREISIGTEEVEDKERNKINVSTINITLSK